MKKRLLVASLIIAALFAVVTTTQATVPQKINYQGYLTNPGGVPLTGTYPMVFSLCNAASGGSCSWTETQSVSVDKGIFNVALGVVTPITLLFDAPYYLDIQVNGEQMSTRQPLTSVGYAFRAENANTATTATTTTNFTGPLGSTGGDVTGTQGSLTVNSVGGVSAAQVASGINLANNATDAATNGTIVRRSASGNFSVLGVITANTASKGFVGNLQGNADTATTASTASTAVNFSGSLSGDVTGTQGATVVNSVGGITASGVNSVQSGVTLANNATSNNTANTIVRRDASGNFTAGEITASRISGTGSLTTGIHWDVANSLSIWTAGTQRFSINPVGTVSINGLAPTAGVVHNDAAGNLSSALIVNSDVDAAAAIADTKLAMISTAGKVLNSATTATNASTASAIVSRDASGNFAANMITINGTPTNATDVATKQYVDAEMASGGLVTHAPVVAVSTTNLVLAGNATIDGVFVTLGQRVLVTGQNDPKENGLWIVNDSPWLRSLDFNGSATAGNASVLVTSGDNFAGTTWACSTPNAVIGTDPISFVQSSASSQTTAANVGAGAGQVYRDKTGATINLKTIAAGSHLGVANNANDVTLSTDATAVNSPNTIVARDSSGNFSAGTITASLIGNVTGNLTGNATTATTATSFSGSLAGDVSGTQGATTVTKIQGNDVASTAPTTGQMLIWNGSQWAPATFTPQVVYGTAATGTNIGTNKYVVAVTCSAGKKVTGGGCTTYDTTNDTLVSSYPFDYPMGSGPTANQWVCIYSGGTGQRLAYAICM